MPMFGPTNDHDKIRQWAAVYGAVPVEIATLLHDGEPTKVGFLFTRGEKSAPELKPISWEHFFALFDLLALAFVYDDAQPDQYELLQTEGKVRSTFSAGPS